MQQRQQNESGRLMPVLFVGHGSPLNAIEDNEFSRAWAEAGKSLPRPRAILCISAHWVTDGTCVSATPHPGTIHDFYGFPRELYQVRYPAPGSPELAAEVVGTIGSARIVQDATRGIDHGAWAVLCRMFPDADVPVVQLSLDAAGSPEHHYALGRELAGLRRAGVLIVGSGNIVHNLGMMEWRHTAFDWASAFDSTIARLIDAGEHERIIHYETLGDAAALSVPTNEHYLPLLYILALQEECEPASFFADKVTLGSVSMRSVRIGKGI